MMDFELVRRERYWRGRTEILFQRLSDHKGRPYVFNVLLDGKGRRIRVVLDCNTQAITPSSRHLDSIVQVARLAQQNGAKTVVWGFWYCQSTVRNLANRRLGSVPIVYSNSGVERRQLQMRPEFRFESFRPPQVEHSKLDASLESPYSLDIFVEDPARRHYFAYIPCRELEGENQKNLEGMLRLEDVGLEKFKKSDLDKAR